MLIENKSLNSEEKREAQRPQEKLSKVQPDPSLLTHPGSPDPASSHLPGFPLAIDKQVVEEEESSLLDVARRDF